MSGLHWDFCDPIRNPVKKGTILLWIAVFAGTGIARVIHVPQEAPTIQAGLDSLSDGDTVFVALGIYAEALIAPPLSFVLRGEVSPDTGVILPRPLIDPSSLPGSDSLGCLFLPEGSHPIIEELGFRNGPEMYPRYSGDFTGGIRCLSRNPVLRRCVLDTLHRGLFQEYDSTDVIIELEECQFRGDSIYCVSSSWCTILATDCSFSGWGLYLICPYSHSRILRCRFEHNAAGNLLFVHGQDVVIEDCIFEQRQPNTYIPVRVHEMRGVITGCLFTNTQAVSSVLTIRGGVPDSIEISRNVFYRNRYSEAGSQGLSQISVSWPPGEGSGTVARIEESVFTQCSTMIWAGAIDCGLPGLEGGAEIIRNRIFDLWPPTVPTVQAMVTENNPVTLRENLIWNNGTGAEGTEHMDARWNWWGHESGPYHSTRNPLGQGDEVQGDLLFDPWHPDTSFLSIPGIGKPLPEQFIFETYPNPFNSAVTLKLIPPEVMIVRVELFDILGRRVKELWSGPLAFEKQITFDGANLSSGIYFVRVWQPIGNRPLALEKLVLLK